MTGAMDAATTIDKLREWDRPFCPSPTDAPPSPEAEFERLSGGVSLTGCVSPDRIALAAHPNPEGRSAIDTSAHLRLFPGDNGELVGRSSRSELPGAAAHETQLVRRAEQIAVANGQDRLTFEAPVLGEAEPRIVEWEDRGYSVTRDGTTLRATKEHLGQSPLASAEAIAEAEAKGLDARVISAQEEIRSAPNEVLYAFGTNGEATVRQEGTVNEVDPSAQQIEAMQGCDVLLHNHPSGASFSGSDIALAVQADVGELRAVAPDGTVYLLRPPEGSTFREAMERNPALTGEMRSARSSGDFARARNVIETTWRNQCAEVQKSVSQKVLDHLLPSEQAQAHMFDEASRRLAERWGLEYEKRVAS